MAIYRVIISGDRNWSDSELEGKIRQLLLQMPRDSEGLWTVEIVHGACYGVDLTSDRIARELGFTVVAFPADWQKYGRAAGPIRNQEMLDYICERSPGVYLFHKRIEESKGTKNMMEQARKRGVSFLLIERGADGPISPSENRPADELRSSLLHQLRVIKEFPHI